MKTKIVAVLLAVMVAFVVIRIGGQNPLNGLRRKGTELVESYENIQQTQDTVQQVDGVLDSVGIDTQDSDVGKLADLPDLPDVPEIITEFLEPDIPNTFGYELIETPMLRDALRQAWDDSNVNEPHQEGGYITIDSEAATRGDFNTWHIERWPRGSSFQITPSSRVIVNSAGEFTGLTVFAEFYTYPGIIPVDANYQQIASKDYFAPSYIVTDDYVYRVQSNGSWDIVGDRVAVLGG